MTTEPHLFSSLNRRQFIAGTLTVIGTQLLQLGQDRLDIYAQESGTYGGNDPLCIGLLFMKNTEQHKIFFEGLRKKYAFQTRAIFKSRNKYKLGYTTEIWDYFRQRSDLWFSARLISKDKWKILGKRDRETVYRTHYKQLILEGARREDALFLNLTSHFRSGADDLLHTYLRAELPSIKDIHIVRSVKGRLPQGHQWNRSDAMDFADLLTGSVRANFDMLSVVKNNVKLQLISNVVRDLQVKGLTDEALVQNRKFRVQIT